MYLFLSLFLLFLIFSTSQSSSFCKLRCQESSLSTAGTGCDALPETNCKYHTQWIDPGYDKGVILRDHNMYRSFIAAGNHDILRPCSNMKELVWDDELENLARYLVTICRREEKDVCGDKDFLVGLVLGIDNDSLTTPPSSEYFKVPHVKMWYAEGADIDTKSVHRYTFNAKNARFTQLIWADTERVGCTLVRYKINGKERESLVCIYAPPGNQEKKPVYKEGPTASDCPTGFQRKGAFPELCSQLIEENNGSSALSVLWSGTAVLGDVIIVLINSLLK